MGNFPGCNGASGSVNLEVRLLDGCVDYLVQVNPTALEEVF